MTRNLILGVLAALAASLVASAWQLASRHGATVTFGPLDLALMRYGIPALLLCPLYLKRGFEVPKTAPKIALVLLVLGGGLPFGLLVIAGAQWAPASHIGVFMAGSIPLFTALGGRVFKGHTISRQHLFGLGMIACGMLIFAIGNVGAGLSTWRGDLLLLAAGVLWAAYSLSFRLTKLTPWEAAAFVNGWSSILLVPLVLIAGVPRLLTAPWSDVALQAVGQGVVAGVLGLVAYTVAIARLGPARASLSTALVPVMTALGGSWVLNEQLTVPTLWVMALIAPGIVIAGGALSAARSPAR
ncbi:DMT family transporter [Variovorax paradoxus]|nr:DMT family transporter [Variovorax paradoxus]MBT2304873.1 DMT family transporter [Variovorax paradoxus]